MICFDIYINDKYVSRAGIKEFGVLSAILTWTRRSPDGKPEDLPESLWEDWEKEELNFDVAGLDTQGEEKNHLDWIRQDLSVGDQVRIEIVESEECDQPRINLDSE